MFILYYSHYICNTNIIFLYESGQASAQMTTKEAQRHIGFPIYYVEIL